MNQNQNTSSTGNIGKKVTLNQAVNKVKELKDGKSKMVLARIADSWYAITKDGNIRNNNIRDMLFFSELSTKIGIDVDVDICVSVPITALRNLIINQSSLLSYQVNTVEKTFGMSTSNELTAPMKVDRDNYFSYGQVKNHGTASNSKPRQNNDSGVNIEILSSSSSAVNAISVYNPSIQSILTTVNSLPFTKLELAKEWLNALSTLQMKNGTVFCGHDRYYVCDSDFHEPESVPTKFHDITPVQHYRYDRKSKKNVADKSLFDREFSISSKSAESIVKTFDVEKDIYYVFTGNTLLLYSVGFYLAVPVSQYADYTADTTQNSTAAPSILSRKAAFGMAWYSEILTEIRRVAKNDSDEIAVSLRGDKFIFYTRGANSWITITTMPFTFDDETNRDIDSEFCITVKLADLKAIAKHHKEEVVLFDLEQHTDALGNKRYGLKLLEFKRKKGEAEKVSFEFWGDTAIGITDKRANQHIVADNGINRLTAADNTGVGI